MPNWFRVIRTAKLEIWETAGKIYALAVGLVKLDFQSKQILDELSLKIKKTLD